MSDEENLTEPKAKKKKSNLRYILYILIVLVATAVSLTMSLWGNVDGVIRAFAGADWRYMLLIFAIVAGSYLVDGLIIFIFCRLYTRRYRFHQGFATSLIGQFYSNVTPGASGGQVMEAYTLKSQGIQVSNAASIMVMWFILYQVALLLFDIVAFAFEWQKILSIRSIEFTFGSWTPSIPMLPLIIVGFLLNVSVIFLLMGMSYSHHFHNFILHYVISFLGKIHLLKNPDKTRESLRVQVENFKIELRRLQANVPVVILQVILFLLMIFMRSCIPYFAGMALHAWEGEMTFNAFAMFEAAFLSSFHQMVTGLIPLPGSAGVSELVYTFLFSNFFNGNNAVIASTQILWRTATFHVVLLVTGFVAAFYRSRPKEPFHYANRATFVTLQLETYDERKRSADTMYETAQLSRKNIQERIAESNWFKRKKQEEPEFLDVDAPEATRTAKMKKEKPAKPQKQAKSKRRSRHDDDDWGTLDI